jgi:pyridoxal phosphate enzyme (YggS family)
MTAAPVSSDIGSRLDAVRARIANAARASGRDPSEIRLVAVSKTKDAASVRVAHAAGQRDFGENYAQELLKKAAELEDLRDIRWHFIGHLQRNKAKVVAPVASVVHTVDSARLAVELGKRAAERLSVLVEVNVGDEDQKSGCRTAELGAVLDAVEKEPRLRLTGLMTVPPASDDPEASRRFFDELARLRDAHGGRHRLPELSMGMSHDLEEAIRAGATIVRVGTAIFGART